MSSAYKSTWTRGASGPGPHATPPQTRLTAAASPLILMRRLNRNPLKTAPCPIPVFTSQTSKNRIQCEPPPCGLLRNHLQGATGLMELRLCAASTRHHHAKLHRMPSGCRERHKMCDNFFANTKFHTARTLGHWSANENRLEKCPTVGQCSA